MFDPDTLALFHLEEVVGSKDLSVYWYAAKRFLSGGDPYLSGEDPGPPFFGPPGFLLLMSWMGLLGLRSASAIMLIANVCMLVTIYVVTARSLAPKRIAGFASTNPLLRFFPLLFTASFLPVLQTIVLGQVAILYTLTLTAFLYASHARKGDTKHLTKLVAGAIFAATTTKPHLLALFYLYLFILAVRKLSILPFLGLCFGSAVLILIPLGCPGDLYSGYFRVALNAGAWMTPTIGAWLVKLTAPEAGWIRFLPLIVGIFFIMFRARHFTGSFGEMLLMVTISLVCAPYLWTYDFSLLLPGVILLSAQSLAHRSEALCASSIILIPIVLILCSVGIWFTCGFMENTVWFPPALLVLQMVFMRKHQKEKGTGA